MDMLPQESERWKRQVAIPQFGIEAQIKLKESKVAIFGVGGVGCPTALYLAAAGVQNLVLVDYDTVNLDNLNRQILYGASDIGRSKVKAAANRLLALDSSLNLEIVNKKVDINDIKNIVKDCTFVVDAFDKDKDRLMVNEACVEKNITAAHGCAQELAGELIVIRPGETACLNCVLDRNFPERTVTPILGVAAGHIGVYLAGIAIKFITGYGMIQAGHRMFWDLAIDQFLSFPLNRRSDCKVCGNLSRGG